MNRTINQLVGEIASLAVVITSNTEIDVFLDYQAHCNSLNIRIHSDGWKINVSADINENVYTKPDKHKSEKKILGKLECIKQRLINIARKGKIDFSKMPYELVQVKKYCLIQENKINESEDEE